MKKLNTSVALAALAAILATPAVAADVEVPMPEAVANWTAFHIGVGGGGNFAFVDESAAAFFENENNNTFAFAEHFSDLGKAGFFGTVEAGFDWQIDSFVIGALANYDFGKTKMDNQSNTVVADNNGNIIDNATFETEWKIGDSWAVGGRLGFLAMDNALIYAVGGYTQAKVKSSISLSADNENGVTDSFSSSDSSWEDGYFVGGGIEALLTENISLKAEYRFNDYGKVDRDDSVDAGNFEAATSQSGDVTVHSVRAVLSYRFGLF